MRTLLQFREQKRRWYDRATVCIITCLAMIWLFWFSWVGIRLAFEKGSFSYLFTPAFLAFGSFFVFTKTFFRSWKRWQTYKKLKSI